MKPFFPLWKVAMSSPFLLSSLFLPPRFTYIIYVTIWQNESKKHVNGKSSSVPLQRHTKWVYYFAEKKT